MSENNRFLEAYGIKVVEQEKLDVPSKPERIKEAAGYVHRSIIYTLENLGGKHWALVVCNRENKEKFERHPLNSQMVGSVLDMLGAVDFDNWDGAKLSLKKLHFKQLGAVEPVAPVEPKKEGSSKKFEASGYQEKKILYKGAVITVWSDDGEMWGIQAFNKKTRKEIFSGGLANFDKYSDALKDAKDGVDEFHAEFGEL
jgi:hypothetical protein